MFHSPAGGTDVPRRRGMLLLLVVSILALFIMIGGVAVLLAIRARESARAFAAASASPAASAALAREQLDAALLKLIRGPSQAGVAGDVTESLLEDKYGGSQSCSVTALTNITNGAFASTTGTARVTGLDLSNPAAIAGRVLTFVPAPSDPTGPTSYRILRAAGTTTSGTLLLANVKPTTPLPLPTVLPCDAVINGREFAGTQPNDKHEPYDAFDDPNDPAPKNPFLTQPVVQNSTVTSVKRTAFGTAGAQTVVDNDGDGVPDGIWLPNVLPPQRSPDGGQLTFEVSYLVLDLDGRINVNAHGSFVRMQSAQTTAEYPKNPNTVPVGMGFGPADVDAARLVGPDVAVGQVPARYIELGQGGTVTPPVAATSSTNQWRPSPQVEAFQPGRYAQGTSSGSAAPGNWSLSTGTNQLNADRWAGNQALTGNAPPNSPTDFKAQLQVYTEGSPPTLRFARSSSAPAWVPTGTDDVVGTGTNAHPYALRLDEDAPRAAGGSAVDAPFTLGELERLLRPFDADAAGLAPRLAAILDDFAERSRMTVTTDSWDTPAITGSTSGTFTASAASMVAAGGSPYTVLSPETVAGLRFNLNRPIGTGTTPAAQEYFKQLYTLAVAVGVPAPDAAQWAANVIEFRDPDSVMTWYPYDTNPLDGVWTTGTGVWGVERPEMVITKVAAKSGDRVEVTLQRPNWKAELVKGPTATVSGTTELIDGSLGSRTANTLEATKVVSGSPVWMVSGSTTSGTGLNTLLPSATAVGPNGPVGMATITVTSGTVFLLRLADPNRGVVASIGPDRNDYVPVHSVGVPAVDATVDLGSPSRWLHWPNRDLVSHGELLVVPSGRPAAVAAGLFREADEAFLALTGTLAVTGRPGTAGPSLLDATIVPSRFAGAHVSVASGATFLAGTGFENFQHGQFSRWREAGRVNINTILPNTGNDFVALDDAVWAAVIGRSGVQNPVTTPAGAYAPIKTDRDLLVGGGDARFNRSGADAATAFLKRSAAIRLANVGTVRSHVFAVWITLRITDSSPNAGPPQVARLFAIVDRSIPVGYAAGRTLNVRETIRLQRFLP